MQTTANPLNNKLISPITIILKTAVKENENGADTRKHAGF